MFSTLRKTSIFVTRPVWREQKLIGNIRYASKSTRKFTPIVALHEPKISPQSYTKPFSLDLTAELKEENIQLMCTFPDVIRTLNDFAENKPEFKNVSTHFIRALEYNVPHGKKLRGLTAAIAYKELIGKQNLTPEHIKQGYFLAWCIELLQSVYLMSDDIVDCSQIRRNQPCWYKLEDVNTVAINDILMIENACYQLLKKSFGHLPCYPILFELFHETATYTFIGQSHDFQLAKAGIETFTMNEHKSMSDYKTSHSAFYAPIALPMILAGHENSKLFDKIKEICFDMGHFYQVQNDFLDCFSITDELKKPGTDIEENKCTWLSVVAMEVGTKAQKNILKTCYGKNDPKSVSQVKEVYEELNFPQRYIEYEEQTFNIIKSKILKYFDSCDSTRNILIDQLNRTFNRT